MAVRTMWSLAAIPLGLFAAYTVTPGTAAERSIHGQVIDAGTRQPLAHVRVVVLDARRAAETSESGAYTMRNLPTEAVRVEFRHPCYFPVQVTIPAGREAEVTIGMPFDEESLKSAGCGGRGARGARGAPGE